MRRAPQMSFQGGFHAFPGGQLDPDEDAKVCAARELLEETGARVDPDTFIEVGRWLTPAFAPRRFDTCFFLADVLQERNRTLPPANTISESGSGRAMRLPGGWKAGF